MIVRVCRTRGCRCRFATEDALAPFCYRCIERASRPRVARSVVAEFVAPLGVLLAGVAGWAWLCGWVS